MLHIGQAHPRGPIPGFPRDSAVLPGTSVSSGRAPMCRRTCSAHGRVSTVLNAGAFPHDSADPSPAGPGRMCSTVSTRPLHASEPGGPVPTPRMRPRHRTLRPPRAQGRAAPTRPPAPSRRSRTVRGSSWKVIQRVHGGVLLGPLMLRDHGGPTVVLEGEVRISTPGAPRRRAPRSARSSLNPRARHSGRRARGLSDVLAG